MWGMDPAISSESQPLWLDISLATQRLALWRGSHLVKAWPCSTAKLGIGFVEGSNKTPLGNFEIREKHGQGAPLGTIFKARQPVGLWTPAVKTDDDLILTRILWLGGLEKRNANTYHRYIYIHGTNDEAGLGRPGSHGCVRMRNADVLELFDQVPTGTQVWIEE